MITHKNIKTAGGKNIDIYDGLFTDSEIALIYNFCQTQNYNVGYLDTSNILYNSNKANTFFAFKDRIESIKYKLPLLYRLLETPETQKVTQSVLKYVDSYSILANPSSVRHKYHIDHPIGSNKKTILYYANSNWDKEWGGGTLFLDQNEDFAVSTQYKPGRVVIYDSDIVHKPAPLENSSELRFVIVIGFLANG